MRYQIEFEKLKKKASDALYQKLGAYKGSDGFMYYDSAVAMEALPQLLDDEFVRAAAAYIKDNFSTVTLRPINLANVAVAEWHTKAEALIDRWDVRQVAGLIRAFPEIVAAKYRAMPITCYMADSEDCPWIVEFGGM